MSKILDEPDAPRNLEPEFKTDWLEALRSGKYRQSKGLLRNNLTLDQHGEPGYCCLGVAMECRTEFEFTRDNHVRFGNLVYSKHELSTPIRDEINLSEDVMQQLIHFNDSAGCSFKEIADWVEEHL